MINIDAWLDEVKSDIKHGEFTDANNAVDMIYEQYTDNPVSFTTIQKDRMFNYIGVISKKLYG